MRLAYTKLDNWINPCFTMARRSFRNLEITAAAIIDVATRVRFTSDSEADALMLHNMCTQCTNCSLSNTRSISFKACETSYNSLFRPCSFHTKKFVSPPWRFTRDYPRNGVLSKLTQGEAMHPHHCSSFTNVTIWALVGIETGLHCRGLPQGYHLRIAWLPNYCFHYNYETKYVVQWWMISPQEPVWSKSWYIHDARISQDCHKR